MCRTACVALALGLAIVAPVSEARAQDTVLTRLRTRAESLLTEWRRASALADVVDSLERERAAARSDTIAVGALRIITNESPLPLREAAARAWPVIDSLYGAGAAQLVAHPYIIRAVDPDPNVRRAVLHVGLEVPWDLDLSATTAVLVNSIPLPPPDAAMSRWLGAPLRPSLRPRADRTAVYLQLLTAPSQPVRQCFLGDVARCRDVLELDGSGDALERWYPTPIERRALVTRSFAGYFDRGANAPAFRDCVAGRDRSCTELLRSLPPGTLPKPLGSATRATLLHHALRAGGHNAYLRLLRDPAASMGARVADAAGLPIDSLIAAWRTDVIAARPAPVGLPLSGVFAALAWAAVFGACGLRSSRWRL